MILMYAIPNCDTVKKARTFLEHNKIDYSFIDFKKSPPTHAQIKAWSEFFGELPVNKKGMTYRKYQQHFEALNKQEQIEFISSHASIIKRPILELNGKTIAVGFNEDEYQELKKQTVDN